jgi:NADP-dependent 3-hydroxy acid dehydrogenase YdfG
MALINHIVCSMYKEQQTIMEDIVNRIWELSPRVQQPQAYVELTRLTHELIKLYDSQDRLTSDPFQPSRERTLTLSVDKLKAELHQATCIVTGGWGCVGSILVNELLKFDVRSIVILDNKANYQTHHSEKVVSISADIRNLQQVRDIFALHQPEFVFHAAAQRDPGVAELNVEETVSTNVVGTLNIVRACESTPSVKQLISSSTGKASRYITNEVYAATKKMGEFIMDTYARTSHIKYSMVRCTHILDNSLMDAELKDASENNDFVQVHSPGKYVTAQNAKEAVYLMLNAVLYAKEKQCIFLLVRYLAWPVESLQMALYYIKQSGGAIPIVFVGNPVGYSEKFFRGQLDWSQPMELNLLINVYEQKHATLNVGNDIIISHPCSTDKHTLLEVLNKLEEATGEQESKFILLNGLREIIQKSLKQVDKKETLDILRWGTEPTCLEMDNLKISDFDYIIPLLVESVAGSEYSREAEELLDNKHAYAPH